MVQSISPRPQLNNFSRATVPLKNHILLLYWNEFTEHRYKQLNFTHFERTHTYTYIHTLRSNTGLWSRIRIYFPSWIWIRIQYANPDPGGKNIKYKQKKCKKIGNNCKFIQFFNVNLQKLHCFLLLSNLLCFLQLKKTLHKYIFYTFVKAGSGSARKQRDPDPHSEKLLDPDPLRKKHCLIVKKLHKHWVSGGGK